VGEKDASPGQRAAALLKRLHTCYEKRRSLPGGAAREKLDAHLVTNLTELAELGKRELQPELKAAPPRRMSIALGLALHSHAHLTIFFSNPNMSATEVIKQERPARPDFPILLDQAKVRSALGLQDWELDDLREEVDRRVGHILKQQRALDWLWAHFGLPQASAEPLFRVLFPGASRTVGNVGLVHRGAQLYAVVDQNPAPPISSMYLGWGDTAKEQIYGELGPFGGRYVDVGLRNALARGIGADADEVIEILDRMVTVVPRQHAAEFLHHDNWRARALAGICKLGDNYAVPVTLTRSLQPEEIETSEWITLAGDELKVRESRTAFDTLALDRVASMTRQLYAEMLARLIERGENKNPMPEIDDLELFDVSGQFRRALKPLIDWAGDTKTITRLAEIHKLDSKHVSVEMKKVRDTWRAQMDRGWCAPPRSGQPRSVAAVVSLHLVETWCALRAIQAKPSDKRFDHRDLMILAAGHFMAEAPVQRLWAGGLSDVGSPADEPFSEYFWATWAKMMETLEEEPATFSGPFTLEF